MYLKKVVWKEKIWLVKVHHNIKHSGAKLILKLRGESMSQHEDDDFSASRVTSCRGMKNVDCK